MKHRLKKAATVALLGVMTVTMSSMPSMAATMDQENYQRYSVIQPRLTYIVESMNSFGISNGVATVDCWVTGDFLDATKAKVIAELQVKSGSNWIPVKIWTDTQNGYRASVYEEYPVNPNNTYRVKATFYVWEGSQSDDLILFSEERP